MDGLDESDIGLIPDPAAASIQIAPPAPQENDAESPGNSIELGDLVVLEIKGQPNIVGIVYYRDENLLRIKQNDGYNRLLDFQMDGADFADEELERLESYDVPRKRAAPSFVEQNNLAAGQLMYVYDKDGHVQLDGDTGKEYTYKITYADVDADMILYEDKEGKEMPPLNFNFRGIPKHTGFDIIQTKEPAEDDQAPAADAAAAAPEPPTVQEQIEQEEIAESAAADAEEGEIDFVIIGTVKMPIMAEIQNIPTNEQVYADVIQKSDLLTDLMKDLDDVKRRNPQLLRKLRTRMELFYALKNELIEYSIDGQPIGMKPTSVETLIEMFKLSDVPLGRPVLDVMQHFYVLNTPPDTNNDVEFDTPMFDGSIRFRNIQNYFELMDEETQLAQTDTEKRSDQKTIQYWPWLQSLYERILRPWEPAYESSARWHAKQDSEFFRKEIPATDEEDDDAASELEDDDEAAEQRGDTYIRAIQTEKFEDKQVEAGATTTSVVRINMSTGRALGPIYRTDDRKKNYLLRPGESAPVNNYILFPLGLTPYIGNNRSGMLARDVEYSQRPIMTMKELLQLYKGITSVPTSNSIFALSTDGKSFGNVSLADYLRDIQFTGLGLGTFDFILRQFGLNRFELNDETRPVLLNKMAQTQNALIDYINKLREELDQLDTEGSKTVNDRLLGDPLEGTTTEAEISIIQAIRDSPLLVSVLETFKNSAPRLANNDIAQVIAFMKAYPDFFVAMLGNVPAIVAKEELHAKRMQFVTALEDAAKIKQHELTKGQPPTPNSCPHVVILRDIARIKDSNERMTKMVKFVTNKEYIGKRDGNWVDCAKCNQHLLCVHEMLQIKQFTRPREQEAILKDIYMKFNGPLVGGHYQCRNCGQPIAELDFDKNLEFDDEGNPMSGRSVLVDRDAEQAARVEQSLMDPTVKDETINLSFKDPKQNDLYEIAKLISEKVGITLTREAFIRIIEGVQRHLAKQDSRKKYSQKVDALRKKDPGKADRVLEYDAFMSRNLIASCAAHVLIEIQTAIPIYRPRYFLPGCAPAGFGGYPLGGNVENLQGINYLACAVAAIRKGGNPYALLEMTSATRQSAWELTGWYNYQSDKQRVEVISAKILQIINDHILLDATIQHQLKIKNQYLRDTYGANKDTGDFSKDQIPTGFLPRQVIITPEEAAKEPVVAEAVKDKRRLADLYITGAHKLARQTAKLYAGSPYAETICCETSITDPRAFWAAQTSLPELPPRQLQPQRTSSRLTVHFTPRPLPSLLVDASPSLYYRVFLELCAVDPFKGRKHEFGFSNKCVNCGLQLPASLLLVKDYIEKTGLSKADAKAEAKTRQAQLEAAEREANTLFSSQGIEINEQTFTDLLNATHNVYSIDPYTYVKPRNIYERLSNLARFEYKPSKDWDAILEKLVDDVQTLDGVEDAERSDYAPFFARISNELDDAVKYVRRTLSTKPAQTTVAGRFIQKMYITEDADFNLEGYLEAISSYFILPMQRICQFVAEDANISIQASYDLSKDDMQRIQEKILAPSDDVRKGLLPSFIDPENKFALRKLEYFVAQLADIVREFKKFNVRNVPGGNYTLMYLVQYCFFLSFSSFLNVNDVPAVIESSAEEVSYINTASKLLVDVTLRVMVSYLKQYSSFSPEDIKTALRARAEKETDAIITRISNLSPAEKDVEMINKVLGLGRYAVGGTKAIYKYSAEQQSRETMERMAAGLDDFKQPDVAEFAEIYGGQQQQGTGYRGEAGYDNMQYGDEDF